MIANYTKYSGLTFSTDISNLHYLRWLLLNSTYSYMIKKQTISSVTGRPASILLPFNATWLGDP